MNLFCAAVLLYVVIVFTAGLMVKLDSAGFRVKAGFGLAFDAAMIGLTYFALWLIM